MEAGGQRMNVRHVQPIVGPEQLGEVPVVNRSGRVLRLADLGTVRGPPAGLGAGVVNEGDGLLLIVQKFRGANTMEVTEGVEQAVDELRPGLPGIDIDTTIFRPATFIEQSIDNLTRALLIGVLLVIFIIVAFLFEWRTAFISLIAIPLSLIAAILVLDLGNRSINVMVLAGLVVAIGVVVDDAIIDVENIVRRLRRARAEGSDISTFRVVLEASVEARSAITYATVINVVGDRPLLPAGPVGFVLPAARALLRAGGAGVDAGRADRHAGACACSSSRRDNRGSASPRCCGPKRRQGDPRTGDPPAQSGDRDGGVLMLAGLLIYPTLGSQLLPNFKERDFLMHWLTEPATGAPEETRISVRPAATCARSLVSETAAPTSGRR